MSRPLAHSMPPGHLTISVPPFTPMTVTSVPSGVEIRSLRATPQGASAAGSVSMAGPLSLPFLPMGLALPEVAEALSEATEALPEAAEALPEAAEGRKDGCDPSSRGDRVGAQKLTEKACHETAHHHLDETATTRLPSLTLRSLSHREAARTSPTLPDALGKVATAHIRGVTAPPS